MQLILLQCSECTTIRPITLSVGELSSDSTSATHSCSTDQWMMVMSTQLIGFSIGGIARRFLVQPPSMIWPTNLVTCALFNTLHAQNYAGVGTRGGISRERFFFYAFLCSVSWYFFPGYIFQALSY